MPEDVEIIIRANSENAQQVINDLKRQISEMGKAGDTAGGQASGGLKKTSNEATGLMGKVKGVSDRFTGLNGVITGAMGAAGLSGFKSMTVDMTMARMQSKALMTSTLGSKDAMNKLYNEMRNGSEINGKFYNGTKQSIIGMDMMLNAMNGVKLSTGITNEELSRVRPNIQKVGEACMLMGDDASHAEFVMRESMAGLNGDFQVLKEQFGITKDEMLATGLWSGAADDVDGYSAALEQCLGKLGDFNGVGDTTAGKLEKIKKNFKTAGMEIGDNFEPYIAMAVDGFLDLQNSCGPLSEAILWVGGGISGLASIAPTISPVIDSFKDMKDLAKDVKGGLDSINIWKKGEDGKSKWDNFKSTLGDVKKKAGEVKDKLTGINFGKIKGIPGSISSGLSTLSSKVGSLKSKIPSLNFSKIKGLPGSIGSSISSVGSTISNVSGKISKLNAIEKIKGIPGSVKSTISGLSGALNSVKGAIIGTTAAETGGTASTGIYAAAKGVLTSVTTACAGAFNALKAAILGNPLLVLAVVVIAVVAALIYFYNTNEQVRNTINGIANTIKGVLMGAWEALGPVIQQVADILQGAWSAACGAFEAASGIVTSAIERMQEVFNGFRSIITGLFQGDMGSVMDGLVDLFGPDLGSTISNGLDSAINTVKTKVMEIPKAITDGLANIGNMVVPGGGLGAGIMAMLNPLPTLIGAVFQRIAPTVMPMIQGAWNTITGLFGQLGNRILQTFTSIPTRIAQSFMRIVTTIRLRLNQARAIAQMMMTNLRNAIISRITSIPGRVGAIFMMFVQTVRNRLTQARAQASQIANMIKQGIIDKIQQMYTDARNWFSQLASNIGSWLSTAAANTLSGAKQIYDNIINKVKDIPQKVADEFGKIPGKISSALSSAAAAAASGAAAIVSSFKSALGIASPGYAQRMTEAEFNSIPMHIENSGVQATAQAYKQASNIVNSWSRGMNPTQPGLLNSTLDVGIVGRGLQQLQRPVTSQALRGNTNNTTRNVNNDNHSKTVIVKEIKLDCNNLTQAQSRRILYNALEGL